ncbi:hypothetical protein ASPWEDRAFT_167198 [Aspergillus wentii DTO 134E9]|uniref:J domain-containing protein n=1 Tax=Aspergillus wentii DTO 134E9 TaxID=1073089 RepID=A0A1L9S203_ASPWE|nr:uncharacterized protein ASPWEDRAFT_167198 [Aspergillus wentii DTO 134E9]KAI9930848.1 hypothetical protein MW887_010499 [Aspergillus wentii]OJJ41166.1 hypothetical protein ASPWEDRAFT_167198 [Aspergillus wentii DTO 134E9]
MPSPRVRTCASFLVNHYHRPSPTSKILPPGSAASFSATATAFYASSREPTYYEILDVPITASTAEIKKQFYSLSLKHHPDRNRDDPTASSRFARISSAYNVLSQSTKRATYDRDHGIFAQYSSSTHSTANPGQHPMGSHSSYSANLHSKNASYAGSRPASGLSQRRGPFRGPPPSFYAHGGYGNNAHRRSPGGHASASSFGAAGGAKEEDPLSFIDRNTLHHFNARGHYRTQAAEDARREERRSRAMAGINEKYIGNTGDFALRFILVFGTLIGAGVVTGLFWQGEKKSKEKGNRRR